MYHLRTDRVSGIIHIAIEGFWTVPEVAAFARDLGAEAASFHAEGRTPALFYDYTRAVIQSQDVVGALSELGRRAPAGARKVAIFTEGRLARRQAARVAAASDRIAVFDAREDALSWLADVG